MKILLVTFDKQMENKVRELLKGYQIISAKNGEEALLLNIDGGVDLVIYDALAGGIAEDDINRLYDEGFKEVPYIILMDDLFPIEPSNLKPKLKQIISREVDINKLPEIVNEMLSKKESVSEEKPSEAAETEEIPKEETLSWEKMSKLEETSQEEKKEEISIKTTALESSKTANLSAKKRCLLVSFDIPLVEKIEDLIKDKCEIVKARSAKQALKNFKDQIFDIIIFDTISGVFAEKGVKDLYNNDNFKDSLYIILLDEFMPIDIEKLPVKNLRAIKRESELNLLPEIVEKAPSITASKVLEELVHQEKEKISVPETVEEKEELPKKEETFEPVKEESVFQPTEDKIVKEVPVEVAKTEVEKETLKEENTKERIEGVSQATISEDEIEKIVESKLNERVVPLIEDLINSKLNDNYIKTLIAEIITDKLGEEVIKEIIREIAEPLVKEVLDSLLSD